MSTRLGGAQRQVIHIESNIPEVVAALKEARREINRTQRDAMQTATERTAVPIAKSLAPGILRQSVFGRADLRGGYLTSSPSLRGWKRARFWYLHGVVKNDGAVVFPGAIRKPFRAKRGRPIPIRTNGGVIFRMSVIRPRQIRRPKKFLVEAAQRALPAYVAEIERTIPEAIERKVAEVSSRVRPV